MTDPSLPPEVEGVLSAHRQILELLLAAAAVSGPAGEATLERLELRLAAPDASEDPGAVLDESFAIQRALDAEVRRMVRNARAIADGAVSNPRADPHGSS